MTQYIPKSALVAEINKLIKKNELYLDDNVSDSVRFQKTGAYSVLCNLRHSLDTLEVKEADLEKDVKQILSLYYEGIKHYDDIIKEEREENGGSDLAIKIMDGVVDARELGIQYVIDKLKAQKGENNYHG